MKSLVVKRSVTLAKHKTSVSLEGKFWDSLKEISASQGVSVHHLVEEIDQGRDQTNLSSAVRLFVLSYYKDRQPATRQDQRAVMTSGPAGL